MQDTLPDSGGLSVLWQTWWGLRQGCAEARAGCSGPGLGGNKTKRLRGLGVQSAEQCVHNSVSEKCVSVLSVQRSRVTSEVRGQGCQSAHRFQQVLQRLTTSRFQAMKVPAARGLGVLFQDNMA